MRRSWRFIPGFVLLWFLFLGASGYSQNIIQGNDADRNLEAAARAETERWTQELAMSAKQKALMEDKLVEYAIKIDQVRHSKMREEIKAKMLTELNLAENKAMRDILTKQQYDQYLFIKRQRTLQKSPQTHPSDTAGIQTNKE